MPDAAKAAGEQPRRVRGRPFPKGVSGNPKGRPKGSKHRATVLAEALLHGQAEAVIQALVDRALGGDPVCMRLVVERLIPPVRERAVELPIPSDLGAAGALEEAERVTIREMAAGRLTPTEAATVMGVIRRHRQSLSDADEVAPVDVFPVELRLTEDTSDRPEGVSEMEGAR